MLTTIRERIQRLARFDAWDDSTSHVDADPQIGRVIDDKYRIDAFVGRGGMGNVYQAFHKELHKVVALKLVAANVQASATVRDRFSRELQSLARLEPHENVVLCWDGRYSGDECYHAMELVGWRARVSLKVGLKVFENRFQTARLKYREGRAIEASNAQLSPAAFLILTRSRIHDLQIHFGTAVTYQAQSGDDGRSRLRWPTLAAQLRCRNTCPQREKSDRRWFRKLDIMFTNVCLTTLLSECRDNCVWRIVDHKTSTDSEHSEMK